MSTFIRAGWGFTVGVDFARARTDTPIELAPEEHASTHHVIGYIKGEPHHPLGFMRHQRVRVHVPKDAIGES